MAVFRFVAFVSLFSLALSIPVCPSASEEALPQVKTPLVHSVDAETGINKAFVHIHVNTTSTKASIYHTIPEPTLINENVTEILAHISSVHQTSPYTTVASQVGGHATMTKNPAHKAVVENIVDKAATEAFRRLPTSVQNHKAAAKTPCHKTSTKVLAHETHSQSPTHKVTAIAQPYEANGEFHAHKVNNGKSPTVTTKIHTHKTCTKAQNHENDTKSPTLRTHLSRTSTKPCTSHVTTKILPQEAFSQAPIPKITTDISAPKGPAKAPVHRIVVNKNAPLATTNVSSYPTATNTKGELSGGEIRFGWAAPSWSAPSPMKTPCVSQEMTVPRPRRRRSS